MPSQTVPAPRPPGSFPWWRGLAATAWVLYVGYLLLSDGPPGDSLLHTSPATLRTALELSLNFWFVMPLLFPEGAPVLNPVVEALFNLVVAWGLLFWGFLLDGRGQRLPMAPFLVGTAFLTNLFYLPWLALRRPNPAPPVPPLSPLERGAEGKALPLAIAVVMAVAVAWAIGGRADYGAALGSGLDRWADFRQQLGSDRLVYSFGVDLAVFWLFQGWLVPDDMARRCWRNPSVLWLARLLPGLGLILYLIWRPPLESGDKAG